jgi:tetratricopeptide (TPR) repeat protein
MKPRVFVVMPFGNKQVRAASAAAEGKPALEALFVNYDDVYQQLVAPALVSADCEPFRADQESAAGDIRTDMFFELVTADFVVADVSILNPNVFYELGIRHGVGPRGVAHIHGGWEKQPFDIVPDRLFKYDGTLWEKSVTRDAPWEERLKSEAASLAKQLREAIENDKKTIGSPVYSHLSGLKPVDWTGISTARARYFHGVLDDWRERLRVAQKKGWPGDILTLAADAPTRYHREQLLFAAAKALIDLCRFDPARGVLEELLQVAPDHLNAQCQLGLTLNRLREHEKAEVLLSRVVTEHQGDPEAQGILGRVYKDRWKVRWEQKESLEDRQKAAIRWSNFAATAARSYAIAHSLDLRDYYTGINVISLSKILEHLGKATGEAPAETGIGDLNDLASAVRVAATAELQRVSGKADERSQDSEVWARATLGELALVLGNGALARRHYSDALASPGFTGFKANSMLSQIDLLELLGFGAENVQPIRELLQAEATEPVREFNRVFVASGHMVDKPGRTIPRFPQGKVEAVQNQIAAYLDAWGIGPTDLALCGGARGADLLFAELCLKREAHVRLLLPLSEGDFLRESVRLPGTDWEDRYFAVKQQSEVWSQLDRLGPPPENESPFTRNNLWILNSARVEAPPPPKPSLYAVLVWDEQPAGDGPGGTSHFAAAVERLGGSRKIVNPTQL